MKNNIIYPFVVKILHEFIHPGDTVLEVGCGQKQYRSFLPNVEYYGMDLPDSAYLDEEPEYSCSAESMPIDNEVFDFIFGVATFYLHKDPDKTFRECCRVLKPGGRFIAFDYKKSLLKKMNNDERFGEMQTWDVSELFSRLSSAGFEEQKLKEISWMVDYWDYPSSLRLCLRKVKRALGRENSNWMVFYAEKRR